MVYIPIEEVTGDNILNAYHVFTDEDEILSLYATIELCKIYTDLETYIFSVCTTDGEQGIDITLTCTDEKYEYDIDMDYNDKYYSAVSDFNDLLSELAS